VDNGRALPLDGFPGRGRSLTGTRPSIRCLSARNFVPAGTGLGDRSGSTRAFFHHFVKEPTMVEQIFRPHPQLQSPLYQQYQRHRPSAARPRRPMPMAAPPGSTPPPGEQQGAEPHARLL
jgi:hypothetical protein